MSDDKQNIFDQIVDIQPVPTAIQNRMNKGLMMLKAKYKESACHVPYDLSEVDIWSTRRGIAHEYKCNTCTQHWAYYTWDNTLNKATHVKK